VLAEMEERNKENGEQTKEDERALQHGFPGFEKVRKRGFESARKRGNFSNYLGCLAESNYSLFLASTVILIVVYMEHENIS
jgi:hypothetical protein